MNYREILKIVRIDDDTYCVFATPKPYYKISIIMKKKHYNDLLEVVSNVYDTQAYKRGLWEGIMRTKTYMYDTPTFLVSCGAYPVINIPNPSTDDILEIYSILKEGVYGNKLLWKDRKIFKNYTRHCIIKHNEIIEVGKY